MNFALYVSPPSEITDSKKQSLNNLSKWILKEELEYGIIGIGIVIILAFLNYIYQRKFEKVNSKRNIINLTLINFILLTITLILTYYDTYNGLAIEIGYRFE